MPPILTKPNTAYSRKKVQNEHKLYMYRFHDILYKFKLDQIIIWMKDIYVLLLYSFTKDKWK